jgi:MtN3 and saliva related transmembrane protein
MGLTDIIGLLAGTLTTIAFLPQVLKTWKSKSAKDLSLFMFSIFNIGIVLWLIYGILLNEFPMILANGFTFLLSSFILYFKIRHG